MGTKKYIDNYIFKDEFRFTKSKILENDSMIYLEYKVKGEKNSICISFKVLQELIEKGENNA